MWNLFIVGSLQFPNDSTIASLEANQNRPSSQFTVHSVHLHSSYNQFYKRYCFYNLWQLGL